MFLRMIYDDKLAEAAYLIGCQKTGEAIVIDPERDVDRYLKLAAANGLKIVAAAETHIHADFLSGVRELGERGVKVYVSDEGGPDWKYQWLGKRSGGGDYDYRLLKNGDTFKIGGIEFRVLHTPGHTPEHICFMVTDRGGGADAPIGVASGDFVFVGDLGRPDLLETAAGVVGQAEPSAHRLYQSVRQFMEWPDYLQVWPAHGAGSACGKALGAVPQSTVGYEKKFNAAIQAAQTEDGFVKHILAGQPEPPLYFARMKRENKEGPRVLGELPRPSAMSAKELAGIDGRGCAIVDTRPWGMFKSGHAAGALHLPLNNSFTTDAGSMIGAGERIYLIVEQARLEEAVRDLVRVGLDDIAGWMEPSAMSGFEAAGGRLVQTREANVQEAKAMLGDVMVLDARRGTEFAGGRIPGAVNIAHTRLLSRVEEVPRDRPILVQCAGGVRSARACSLLQKHGFDVVNLEGGMKAWEQGGGRVVK